VVGLEPQTNTVVLDDEQVLFKDRIFVDQLFVHPHVDLTKQEFSFKTCRWGHIYRGQIERLPGNQAIVHSQQSVRAPAPGQALVFYQGRRVLGGGIIKHFEFR
jgi:tRNA-specific 2-thiouridylase